MLLLGVLHQLLGEVVHERGVVGRQPIEVGGRQLDVEVVGHRPPLPAEDLRVVVALALEGRGDLHRLHGAAEDAGERAVHHVLEPLLEPLQAAHIRLLPGTLAQ